MLSTQELQEGIEKAGVQGLQGGELKALIAEMDADGSGAIDYTEFIAVAIDRKVACKDDNCRRAFCTFDKNNDGSISMAELRDLLKLEGVSDALGQQTAESVMREVDKNGDGQIDFEEFKAMVNKK